MQSCHFENSGSRDSDPGSASVGKNREEQDKRVSVAMFYTGGKALNS